VAAQYPAEQPLSWASISSSGYPLDIENRAQWPTAFAWLSEQARLFLDAFSAPIKRLAIEDDSEEGIEDP